MWARRAPARFELTTPKSLPFVARRGVQAPGLRDFPRRRRKIPHKAGRSRGVHSIEGVAPVARSFF
jgi:hypothetical protein